MSFKWDEFDKGVFLVVLQGIIYNPKTKKILIGRREKDPYIKEISWCFVGGRAGYDKELEHHMEEIVKEKVNLDVKDGRIIFAKTYSEKRQLLSIYYFITTDVENVKPIGFKELKWIKPTEVKKYFTTSIHSEVFKFLKELERGEK